MAEYEREGIKLLMSFKEDEKPEYITARVNKITLEKIGALDVRGRPSALASAILQLSFDGRISSTEIGFHDKEYHVKLPRPLYAEACSIAASKNCSIAQAIHFMATGNTLEYNKPKTQKPLTLTQRIEILESKIKELESSLI